MGVASIPDHKDQSLIRDEWKILREAERMDVGAKGAKDEFVTVVSVGSQGTTENFVTVLSIGTGKKDEDVSTPSTSPTTTKVVNGAPAEGQVEEEVEVYRLPGERLGFGLKFEGGNKTSERVRRLFVQSCAQQSPASRAKCSWGSLGEGDEVLSIDGVPVTHMTRLDCVRRLKESQLVIRLMVRSRGALRPEVVSAERKAAAAAAAAATTTSTTERKSKVPPELPSVPPPVPPRKLRHPRGSADGDANPTPVKKGQNVGTLAENDSKNHDGSPKESPKGSPKGSPPRRSPDLPKSKQEPPEAMIYLDARSQCESTQGSTSDDTGSSMSTVVDRFSTSDRVSTISTTSTTSTGSEHQQQHYQQHQQQQGNNHSQVICSFEQLERELSSSHPPDYLLRRLASSEAVTHVESRGEVERITAVVAPNTVLIEETIALQPPLSFQDAPLSYGHEARPDLFYAADLAADSTTHFRPIKDDAELVERVVNDEDEPLPRAAPRDKSPPPLPARNHVNRINVVHRLTSETTELPSEQPETEDSGKTPVDAPILPPKPLPRKDVKSRRKRPPPPPPPPSAPRRELSRQALSDPGPRPTPTRSRESPEPSRESDRSSFDLMEQDILGEHRGTNKVLEIIEIRKARALSPNNEISARSRESTSAVSTPRRPFEETYAVEDTTGIENDTPTPTSPRFEDSDIDRSINEDSSKKTDEQRLAASTEDDQKCPPANVESEENEDVEEDEEEEEEESSSYKDASSFRRSDTVTSETSTYRESEDDETYRSLDEVNDDLKGTEANRVLAERVGRREILEDDDTSDESDDGDYYWQSNLATIGEEEETNSLEYAAVEKKSEDNESKDARRSESRLSNESKMDGLENDRDETSRLNRIEDFRGPEDTKTGKDSVNDRMDNCGGGQRLPPDGDEFPAAYQEFGNDNNTQHEYRFSTSATTATTTTTTTSTSTSRMATSTRNMTITATPTMNNGNDSNGNGNNVAGGRIYDSEKKSFANGKENSLKTLPIDGKNVVGSKSEKSYLSTSVETATTTTTTAATAATTLEEKFLERTQIFPTSIAHNVQCAEGAQIPNGETILVSEKKIEIAAYYHKEMPMFETETQVRLEETCAEIPPPLPLTGPPKMDRLNLHARTAPNTDQSPRKFSPNVDPWRQDDKSERSVRDKIAMFSSQSNLDAPLFPSTVPTVPNVAGNVRRLSKYKSSEDVCTDDKNPNQKERTSFFADRTQSSFDLTDSTKSFSQENSPSKRYPSHTKIAPPVPQKPSSSALAAAPTGLIETKNVIPSLTTKPYISSSSISSPETVLQGTPGKLFSSTTSNGQAKLAIPGLTRATSFSGSSSFDRAVPERTSATNELLIGNNQVSRTNSLASTFRRNTEDTRRTSLNQLIEQRRRSISKLRGLVIPEKETVPIEQPIVDLPEIKSRNSILLHQLPKANIQDKWGSQSSISSNASTASVPLKATTSFKMPAPQINAKYSPAFKRKSLAVYGSSSSNATNSATYTMKSQITSTPASSATSTLTNASASIAPTATNSLLSAEPPKSLESICSPTRSDYSFEFASTGNSPDVSRARPRTSGQRKARTDYDDSDNDSAVSSSQSSISRGFSPPMSPVPSERSTVSSERSYASTELNYRRRSFIMDVANKPFKTKPEDDSTTTNEQYHVPRANCPSNERTYVSSERSSTSSGSSNSSNSSTSSGSSNGNSNASSNPRSSPQPIDGRTNSQIPQRQTLRRSNSTETNCSTSSTLTSGSQASAESLSRRVLKPQSVEAINRKNILASARCRSGQDLNGSPLIQRKFSDEEDVLGSVSGSVSGSGTGSGSAENGEAVRRKNNLAKNGVAKQDIKIAYIEVTDTFLEEEDELARKIEEPKLPPKRSVVAPLARPPKSEMLEASNDLKMWVRAEAKALARSAEEREATNAMEKKEGSSKSHGLPCGVESFDERYASDDATSKNGCVRKESEREYREEPTRQRGKANAPVKKTSEDRNDLLTILTTRSRSRSAIHVDDGTFGRSKSQMSLEDILGAKIENPCPKLLRTQSVEGRTDKGSGLLPYSRLSPESRQSDGNRFVVKKPLVSNDSWREEKPFVSKIPTLGRSRIFDNGEDVETMEKSRSNASKIPTARNLGRRSVSVTDMKKALEKIDATNGSSQQQTNSSTSHNRFPSLDSSVDETVSSIGTETDNERFCGEQFGSISSLASSTSLISQQELAQLVEEASLEEARCAHEVIVVLLHKENPTGSVGITLAGGADCEVKEITVHRVLAHSIADKDGRVQRGDRILSINGRSTRGLTHRDSLTVLKQPRSEVVLVVSRARVEEGYKLRSRTASVETIVEGFETNAVEDTAWGPPSMVAVYKDGAGLGFSLEGGRDSPLGDRPLIIKKIFTGGAAEKTGALKAGDQLLEVNGSDVTRMSRIEAWSLMKKLHDGEVNLLVRHPATKSS